MTYIILSRVVRLSGYPVAEVFSEPYGQCKGALKMPIYNCIQLEQFYVNISENCIFPSKTKSGAQG